MTDRPDITTGRAWAYAGVALGGLVSIAANVAHSYVPPEDVDQSWEPEAGAVLGAIFWPVALFVAIEILARIPWPAGKRWTVLRFGGLVPVAVVAAVVSYRHMSGLLAWYREDPLTVAIGPLAVDGLMVMSAGALIATGAWRAAKAVNEEQDTAPAVEPAVVSAPDAVTEPVPEPATEATPEPVVNRTPVKRTRTRSTTRSSVRPASRTSTASAVAKLRSREPDATQADIARRLKLSVRTVRRHWTEDNVTPIRDAAAN